MNINEPFLGSFTFYRFFCSFFCSSPWSKIKSTCNQNLYLLYTIFFF